MTADEQEKMWCIDSKLQLGDEITEEEKNFFNENFDRMKQEMEDNYNHWEYHSGKV